MTADFDPNDYEAAQAAARESVLRERAERRLRQLLDKRPPAFADDGELHPDITGWITRFRQGHPGALVLSGPTGTGKTWSLWKTAETLVRAGWGGRVEITAAYDIKEAALPPVDRERLDTWRDADLLAVDDLGAVRISDWDTDHLHALVDKRWQRHLPTIMTSNEPKLRDIVGPRIASRLADQATIVTLTGQDRRRSR